MSVAFIAMLVVGWLVAVPIYLIVRVAGLGRALAAAEEELRRLRGEAPPSAPELEPAVEPAPAPIPAPRLTRAPAATAPPAKAAPREGPDWESLLGANWLSKLGVAALAVGAAFFLKYAFESGWIGPTAQVATGLAAAAALLVVGQQLLGRPRYRAYAQVLMSGGIVIFFLSVYAAYTIYHLIGFPAAFAALALGAMAASALASANNTEGVAVLCVLGAFLAPVLLHGGGGARAGELARLYFYLTAINGWSALLARRRSWHSLTVLAFGATWLLFFGSQPGRRPDPLLFETFAVLFLFFSCYGGLSSLARGAEPASHIVRAGVAMILLACLAFGVASVLILADTYLLGLPSLLSSAVLLAMVLIGLSVALPPLPEADVRVRQSFVYLSAAALLLIGGAAILAAPPISQAQAPAAFAFSVATYLIFLGLAIAVQRQPFGQGPGAALLAAAVVGHAAAAAHALHPLSVWSLRATPVWLPLAGWIALLGIWPASRRAEAPGVFSKALVLAAQALPLVAMLLALAQGASFGGRAPAGRGVAVFGAQFLLVSGTWIAARRMVSLPGLRGDLAAAVGSAAAFFGLMSAAAGMRTYQGLVIVAGCALALAVYHAAVGAWVLRPPGDDARHRLVYLGLGLTLVTVALPLQLRASALTVAWAAESIALIWAGVLARDRRIRWFGVVLLIIAADKALFFDLAGLPEPRRFLWNLRLLAGGSVVVAAAISGALLARAKGLLSEGERWLPAGLAVAANAIALIFLSLDLWQWLGRAAPAAGGASTQQLSLSLFWSVYALAAMSVGIWRRARTVRLFALGLLLLSAVKVFIFDLGALEQPYRMISFIALGLILLAVSLLYTRFEERLA